MDKKKLFQKIIVFFKKKYPKIEGELNYETPFQLLVAVILSAQCTDKRVNVITVELFKRYPTAQKLSQASKEEIFDFIKSCSYPNNKTNYLYEMSKQLVYDFNCIVPSNLNDLQKLKGVGRKTANVILAIVFNQPSMAVDTHIFRVSARIGLTENAKTPLETEKQLVKYFPESIIPDAHHWLLFHGRYTCLARKPKCEICDFKSFCKYYKV